LNTEPGLIVPGHRTKTGTRQAPSQLVFFSPRNGVIPPSGQQISDALFSAVSVMHKICAKVPGASIAGRGKFRGEARVPVPRAEGEFGRAE
jgi:hypothetical protein